MVFRTDGVVFLDKINTSVNKSLALRRILEVGCSFSRKND